MSVSSSLSNAVSGLTATSRMAEVVSSNLANALTEGYGRREVNLVGGPLGGVRVQSVSRIVDPLVLGERRLADASLANSERTSEALAQLERVVGAADDPFSITSRITALEQSLVSATADPASEQRLGMVSARLGDLVNSLNEASKSVQDLRVAADANIARDVDTLNVSLGQIEKLNADISRAINTGVDPSALMDARQLAVDKVAAIVPIKEVARSGGAIALFTTRGTTLIDGPAATFQFDPTPTIVPDMEYSNGVLGAVLIDGAPMLPDTGFGRLSGGSLEASFQLRDQVLPDAQLGLDQLAADLITRFEAPSADPTLGAADSGLLTDDGDRFDPADLVGLSGRISVNSAVDPSAGGDVSLLRDGVAATAPGPVGDAAQLSRWLNALGSSHTYDPGQPSRSAIGHASNLSGDVSTSRLRAEENLTFETARWTQLKEAQLADGVDSDQELQKLLLIEQAYAANARLVQTASNMLQRLMEI